MISADHSKVLLLRDGRKLRFQSFGAESGAPWLFLHGFPGSRLQAALIDEQARLANAHVVAFDRPGFGGSSPRRNRRIVDIAQDVEALANHLAWDRFSVVGVSCGGAYALACAYGLRQRVNRVALVAGIAPMDVPDLAKDRAAPLRLLFSLARRRAGLARIILSPDRALFRSNPEFALRILGRLMSSGDRKLLEGDDELRDRFIRSMVEAYSQGVEAAAQEAHLLAGPWGFRLADVAVPVDVFQGGADRHVPPAMGQYLTQQLPDARLHAYPSDGHLSIVMSSCRAWLCQAASASERDAGSPALAHCG